MSVDETHWGNSLLSNQNAIGSSVHPPCPHLFLHCVTPHQLGLVSLHMSVSSQPRHHTLKPLVEAFGIPTLLTHWAQGFEPVFLDLLTWIQLTHSQNTEFEANILPICFALTVLIQLNFHPLASTLMFFWNTASPSGPSELLKLGPTS